MDESSVRGVICDVLSEHTGHPIHFITDEKRIREDLGIGSLRPPRFNMNEINAIRHQIERRTRVKINPRPFNRHFRGRVHTMTVGDLVAYVAGLPQIAREPFSQCS